MEGVLNPGVNGGTGRLSIRGVGAHTGVVCGEVGAAADDDGPLSTGAGSWTWARVEPWTWARAVARCDLGAGVR
jgi:hypothetical protein